MSYQALYRRWRPLTFDDVRGQDAIVTTLKNQIKSGRIGHAYLFCGTRGTGKTSIAKIFARAVNCAHAAEHDGSPCNTCAVCSSILSGGSLNVFEIDAASNNGVDNIRDIREQVEYPPTDGRYKVYIIDEVHMLSTGAFNALLKTLEEPPSYVIFILATTDPQKIPQTILSRCQRYDFRRISTETIAGRIHELMEADGLDIEERAVRYVARAADGSMRDALSLLDQCLAFHFGQRLTYENVLDVLGAVDTGVFSDLYRAICGRDVEKTLSITNDLINSGREIGQFVNDFIWYMRNILLAGSVSGGDILDISRENEERLREDAAAADKTTLLRMMSVMSELSNRMRFAAQKRVLLEVELIRLCTAGYAAGALSGSIAGAGSTTVQMVSRPAAAQEKPRQQVRNGSGITPPAPPAAPQNPVERQEDSIQADPAQTDAERPDAVHEDAVQPASQMGADGTDVYRLVQDNWDSLCRELSPANKAVFSGTILKQEQPGAVTVVFKNAMNYKIAAMNREENGLKRLAELVRERLGIAVSFLARQAKPGELDTGIPRVTEEDLLKIHFPVDFE
ncbi:MAG: DNA polymerase III subunit gamma/tau [Eubacteriales bacterium]|nr:DNA polymerase III subunit gamma/tau [Eubacteriales bacterium]